MRSLQPPSIIENVMGSAVTEGALTVIGVLAGGPLTALLPILSKSLAAERQRKRVEAALLEIDGVLKDHERALRSYSDDQYKLINEFILALLHTTSEEKIAYLKRAIRNVVDASDFLAQEAIVLSRIVRDISADEANFLCANFAYDRVQLSTVEADHGMSVLNVKPGTRESLVVTGLVSLGILETAEPTWDESGLLRYSTITAKLLVLLRDHP